MDDLTGPYECRFLMPAAHNKHTRKALIGLTEYKGGKTTDD